MTVIVLCEPMLLESRPSQHDLASNCGFEVGEIVALVTLYNNLLFVHDDTFQYYTISASSLVT
jgi:hypothetical protein